MLNVRAAIDIGSNSVILLIAKTANGRIDDILYEEVNITSLGKNLDIDRKFLNSSMDKTFSVLSEYQKITNKHGISNNEVMIMATEASRVASNAGSFFQKIKDQLGFQVTVVSSDREAFLTALGVVSNVKNSKLNKVSILDIGGASTELIEVKINPFELIDSLSISIGSVRAKDLSDKKLLVSYLNEIKQNKKIDIYKTKHWICVAGTMVTLGICFFNFNQKHIFELNSKEICFLDFKKFVNNFVVLSKVRLLEKYPFIGKRIDMIREGALVSIEILDYLGCEEMTISTFGLRHGTILQGEFDGK